jgi:transcriptional regulator with AAA-type ATPase domain
MSAFTPENVAFLQSVSELAYCNPFLPRRTELEHKILGAEADSSQSVWSYRASAENLWTNEKLIFERLEPIAEQLRNELAGGATISDDNMRLYEDMIHYLLFVRYRDEFWLLIHDEPKGNRTECGETWQRFSTDVTYFLAGAESRYSFSLLSQPEHMFACCFQICRLFHHIFFWIVGSSSSAAKLRSAIWQSVLTHNLRRYYVSLYQCMGDIPTLITGPSGTGKELVARAIAMAQYIPFDSKKGSFVEDYSDSYFAVNLAAMSPTLIESELFGHNKGAFTGATADRQGLFEACTNHGTVFLDEIGELDSGIQVKLLRVLQSRRFQRLGDLADRQFTGKVIAATNRDLANEMQEGTFREDLYYRLCADRVETPTLAEQLTSQPEDLRNLVDYLVKQLTSENVGAIADEVMNWIRNNLGASYQWPGNVRELEQCIRNVMIRGEYRPANYRETGVRDSMATDFLNGSLTVDELLQRYCTMVYSQTGSYEESARRLKIDRRTVKSKVDEKLLEVLNKE